MSCASFAGWNAGASGSCAPRSRRALEIVGVIFAFFWFWPLAVAYLVWKLVGYPMPADVRSFVERGVHNPLRNMGWSAPNFGGNGFGGTGNAAFDEYRRSEIERLEQERRRLDDEARAFRDFVEELKRAKDRSEFDSFMAKRRAGGQADV